MENNVNKSSFVTFHKSDGSRLLEITKDGNVVLGEGVEINEASKEFYNIICQFIKEHKLDTTTATSI